MEPKIKERIVAIGDPIIGNGIIIYGNIALTSKHVIEDFKDEFTVTVLENKKKAQTIHSFDHLDLSIILIKNFDQNKFNHIDLHNLNDVTYSLEIPNKRQANHYMMACYYKESFRYLNIRLVGIEQHDTGGHKLHFNNQLANKGYSGSPIFSQPSLELVGITTSRNANDNTYFYANALTDQNLLKALKFKNTKIKKKYYTTIAHYLDHHVYNTSCSITLDQKKLYNRTVEVFFLSLLLFDEIKIPAVSFCEMKLAQQLYLKSSNYFASDQFSLLGDGNSFFDFLNLRLAERENDLEVHAQYKQLEKDIDKIPDFSGGLNNLTEDMYNFLEKYIYEKIYSNEINEQYLDLNALARLHGQPIIGSIVAPVILKKPKNEDAIKLQILLNKEFFRLNDTVKETIYISDIPEIIIHHLPDDKNRVSYLSLMLYIREEWPEAYTAIKNQNIDKISKIKQDNNYSFLREKTFELNLQKLL